MNKHTAWRFMVAARDDPVLAAWASVCHEHQLLTATGVSPYDAWDAYESLYNHGILGAAHSDSGDAEKRIFSWHPTATDIQEVLQRIPLLCPEHKPEITENPMPNKSPFFQKDNALATREQNKSLGISAPRRMEPLGGAFSPRREVIPQPSGGGSGLEAFARTGAPPKAGLACQDPVVPNLAGEVCMPRVYCGRCGDELTMNDLDSQILPEDGLPGNSTLLVALSEGRCSSCGLIVHCSVAEDAIPDQI